MDDCGVVGKAGKVPPTARAPLMLSHHPRWTPASLTRTRKPIPNSSWTMRVKYRVRGLLRMDMMADKDKKQLRLQGGVKKSSVVRPVI